MNLRRYLFFIMACLKLVRSLIGHSHSMQLKAIPVGTKSGYYRCISSSSRVAAQLSISDMPTETLYILGTVYWDIFMVM